MLSEAEASWQGKSEPFNEAVEMLRLHCAPLSMTDEFSSKTLSIKENDYSQIYPKTTYFGPVGVY